MILPPPIAGMVIGYAYLWSHEHEKGGEEGVKHRPCVIVAAVRTERHTHRIIVLPVTSRPPERPQLALEIPPGVRRHLGLDRDKAWVILDDLNQFTWPGPDLRPVSPRDPSRIAYGILPPVFYHQIKATLFEAVAAGKVRRVKR